MEEMQNIVCALAQKGDMAQLADIRIEYLKSDFWDLGGSGERSLRQKLAPYFERHLNEDLFAFVAKDGVKIVAAAFLVVIEKPANPTFPNGKIGNVLNVFTLPEYRGRGVATRLVQMLLERARMLGLDFVELKATVQGFPLYKKLGFCETKAEYAEMRYRFG